MKFFTSFLLIIFFAIAVFYKLDRFSLWQDEAETALLGRSIAENGLPISYFDNKWVTQFDNGQESNENHLWHITPWLPFYIAAGSFKIFGINDWAARFPFAMAGVISALALFMLALRWTKSHAIALMTLFFYVTNLTVIIYTRQCKYLPVYMLAYIAILYGIITWQEKRKGTLFTVFGFVVLFHCNYLAAGIAFAAFAFYCIAIKEGRACLPLFWKTTIGIAILFMPFLFTSSLGERTARHLSGISSPMEYLTKLGRSVYYWNGQAFPLLMGILFVWKRPPYFRLFASAAIVSWLLLPFFGKDVLRYNLHLMPLFCLMLGYLIVTLFCKNKIAGTLLFLILFFTNTLHNIPDAIHQKSLAPLYLKDDWTALRNYYFKDYIDPIKVIPKMVAERSNGLEYVYLNHDQLVWQWYSDIPFAYLANKEGLGKNPPIAKSWTNKDAIDWWIGPHFVKMGYSLYLPEEEIIKEWQKSGRAYEIIDTGIPLIYWDLSSPIRYKHFLDKFSDSPSVTETIRLVHRVK